MHSGAGGCGWEGGPACRHDDIFLDILHLEGESPEDFQKRREGLEAAVRQTDAEPVEVTITERP